MAKRRTRFRKKEKKNIPNGVVHIQSTFNNTIVTVTDTAGNVVSWSSSGVQGFKGSRKSTPFASQLAAQDGPRAWTWHFEALSPEAEALLERLAERLRDARVD